MDRGSEGLTYSSEWEVNECLIKESDDRIRDTRWIEYCFLFLMTKVGLLEPMD